MHSHIEDNQLKWKWESKCCDCSSCINMLWCALGISNVCVGLIIPQWIQYDRIFNLFFVVNHSLLWFVSSNTVSFSDRHRLNQPMEIWMEDPTGICHRWYWKSSSSFSSILTRNIWLEPFIFCLHHQILITIFSKKKKQNSFSEHIPRPTLIHCLLTKNPRHSVAGEHHCLCYSCN